MKNKFSVLKRPIVDKENISVEKEQKSEGLSYYWAKIGRYQPRYINGIAVKRNTLKYTKDKKCWDQKYITCFFFN